MVKAKPEASFLLSKAGIDAVWIDCRDAEDGCAGPFSETEFPIQIAERARNIPSGNANNETLEIVRYNVHHHLVNGSERAAITVGYSVAKELASQHGLDSTYALGAAMCA
jgi:hypothetical protein